MKLATLLLTILLALSACPKDETISGQTDPATIWVLTHLNDQPVATRITLTFPKQGELAGQAPCNGYSAPQIAPLPWFESGPIASTKMACAELALEARYFEALAAMTLAEVKGDTLVLGNETGELLVYKSE